MTHWINTRYGTTRGAIRLALSWPQHWAGIGRKAPDPAAVKRLVFVCRGNISRSAYADVLARSIGLNSSSMGLSAATGNPADPIVAKIAGEQGLAITAHRSCTAPDFKPQPGDLMLAMEVRQLEQLSRDPRLSAYPRLLLGSFAGVPHIHDPFTLSEDYYRTCLPRIARAVERLSQEFPGARLSG
jgi:protein-tyrosine phosphatase